MRKVILLMPVLCAVFASEHAMAVEMDDLEVTIRVIDSIKEHRGDIGHTLELPASAVPKVEPRQQKGSGEHVGDDGGVSQPREDRDRHEKHEKEKDELHRERSHEAQDGLNDHHDGVRENHERAVEQYQDNKEERRNNSLERREELKEMLDNSIREQLRSGDNRGTDD
jgi:hypothetical protein